VNHLDLLKRAFQITWRYRVLFFFGVSLVNCGGGGGVSGGGGGSNFGFPSGGGGDFDNLPSLPSIDVNTIIALLVALICLVILLVVLGVVVRAITRTALMGMVRHVEETEAVTLADGWQLGWSARAWRLFLVNLIIGIPLAIVTIFLILMAVSPLLLLMSGDTAPMVGIIITIFAVLFVILLLFLINLVIAPFQEIVWRRTVLDQQGVIDSLADAFGLIRRHLKDVVVVWLLMFGIGIGWGIVSLVVVLPVSLIAAVLLGGIPAGLVYLISGSGLGAAIAGVPPALLILILISSVAGGLYLVYQSTVWTLAYLEIQKMEYEEPKSAESPPSETPSATPDLEPES
jgi:hypothetical protein